MKVSKKKIFVTALIIALLSLPFLLLLNPVLEKFQNRNTNLYEQLSKKKEDGENVEEEWNNLKFRQKLLGDVYRYTFRQRKSIESYEKYLEWFREEWKAKEYASVKYTTATLCRKISQGNPELSDYEQKAACHFSEINKWYSEEGDEYEDIRLKSKRAISSFDLRRYTSECE